MFGYSKKVSPYPTGQRNFWMYVKNVQAWMQNVENQMCSVYVGSMQAYMQLLSQLLLLLGACMLEVCLNTLCTLALYTCNSCKMNVHMHSTWMPSTCSVIFGQLGSRSNPVVRHFLIRSGTKVSYYPGVAVLRDVLSRFHCNYFFKLICEFFLLKAVWGKYERRNFSDKKKHIKTIMIRCVIDYVKKSENLSFPYPSIF